MPDGKTIQVRDNRESALSSEETRTASAAAEDGISLDDDGETAAPALTARVLAFLARIEAREPRTG